MNTRYGPSQPLKGEQEHETIHIIYLSDKHYKIKKLSRVNDLEEEYQLNEETIKIYPPGDRKKVTIATSNGLHHINIHTKMPTMNGLAEVTDIKTLITKDHELFPKDANNKEGIDVFLLQELTIKNIAMDRTHTSRRFYVPYHDENMDFSMTLPTDAAANGDSKNDAMDETEDDD